MAEFYQKRHFKLRRRGRYGALEIVAVADEVALADAIIHCTDDCPAAILVERIDKAEFDAIKRELVRLIS